MDAVDGLLVVRTQGGQSVTMDLETGATCAVLVPAPGKAGADSAAIDPGSTRTAVAHGMLVGQSKLRVAAIDVRSGAVRWSHGLLGADDRPDPYALRESLRAIEAGAAIAVSFGVWKKDVQPFRFDEIVAALDPATGAERWRRVVIAHPVGQPASAEGTLSLASDLGQVLVRTPTELLALDVTTGATSWTATWTGPPPLVAAAHGRVALAHADGRIDVRDTRTGARLFAAPASGRRPVALTLGPRAAFVAGERAPGDTEIAALDPQTGAVRWTRRAAFSVVTLRADGDLVFSAEGDGHAWALDADTGAPRWGVTTRLPWPGAMLARTRSGTARVLLPSETLDAFDPPAGARPAPLPPYLRWDVDESPDGCAPAAVSSIDGDERVMWSRALPSRLRNRRRAPCDAAELLGHRRSPRYTSPGYDSLGSAETEDAWILADGTGMLVLRKRDGAVSLDVASPPNPPQLWFDEGTFRLSGASPCTGPAPHAHVLARCGDRFLFFNGSEAVLTALAPWHVEARGAFTAAAPSRSGGRLATRDTTIQLGAQTLELHGEIYMR
jgi:outer membrane protein assembly factor BamB